MIYKSENISLKIKKSAPEGAHFVVSKKVFKTAVRRNLLKKRARAVISEFFGKRDIKESLIFYFKKTANTLSFRALKKEIVELLKKAKV